MIFWIPINQDFPRPEKWAMYREFAAARQPRSIGLDSTTFDSTRYINQLLANTRMQPLLQKQVY